MVRNTPNKSSFMLMRLLHFPHKSPHFSPLHEENLH